MSLITEIPPTSWAVRVGGQIVATNIQSKLLAEHYILTNIPVQQRTLAEAIPQTADGRAILLG